MFFAQVLIPDPRSSRMYQTDLQDCLVSVFSNIFKILDFRPFIFPEHYVSTRITDFLELFGVSWWVQNQESLVCGSWTRPPTPKTMKMKGFRFFPKLKRKVTSPTKKQNPPCTKVAVVGFKVSKLQSCKVSNRDISKF